MYYNTKKSNSTCFIREEYFDLRICLRIYCVIRVRTRTSFLVGMYRYVQEYTSVRHEITVRASEQERDVRHHGTGTTLNGCVISGTYVGTDRSPGCAYEYY